MNILKRTNASLQTIVATVVMLLLPLSAIGAQSEDRWQQAMDRFAELDRESPPKPGGILFLGSSSVRRWDLERWLPGRGATNRGFGGSQIADSVRHFDRLVVPHRPSSIFLASSRSMLLIFPAAKSLRTNEACNMPCSFRSSQ